MRDDETLCRNVAGFCGLRMIVRLKITWRGALSKKVWEPLAWIHNAMVPGAVPGCPIGPERSSPDAGSVRQGCFYKTVGGH